MLSENTASFCLIDQDDDIINFLSMFYGSKRFRKKYKFYEKSNSIINADLNILNNKKANPRCSINRNLMIDQSEHFLALSKPYNFHSHPLSYTESDNLISYLRDRGIQQFYTINRENYDRGLLFRLDYVTSGLILLTNNEIILEKIREDYHQYVLEKSYIAIVKGKVNSEIDDTAFMRGTGKKGGVIQVSKTKSDPSFKHVRTKITPLSHEADKNLSLVLVNIFTGHRHQIRAHLNFLGYPIYGDLLYGEKHRERVYLHSFQYKIKNPISSKEESFRSEDCELFNQFFDLDVILNKID